MTKVVLDTNLLIAARWNQNSSSKKIIDLCIGGTLKACYTEKIKDENLYILSKVKAPKPYLEKIKEFYEKGERFVPGNKITACKDDSDNRFIEAAIAAKAGYILSNDRHLLDVGEYEGVKMLRPSTFISQIP